MTVLRAKHNSATISSMNEQGRINVLIISLIACGLLLLATLAFGAWAYSERQDYKDNSDQKVAAAVQQAITNTRQEEAKKFAEEAKNPLKTYSGPSQFGGVKIQFPKTWSTYVINKDGGNTPISWYFHPNIVPDTSNRDNSYALRVEVVDESYSDSLDNFQNDAEEGVVTVQPYSLPKVPDVIGSRINGEVENDKQGSMILLPLRNLTLKVWTESPDYLNDFNDIILKDATFSP